MTYTSKQEVAADDRQPLAETASAAYDPPLRLARELLDAL